MAASGTLKEVCKTVTNFEIQLNNGALTFYIQDLRIQVKVFICTKIHAEILLC